MVEVWDKHPKKNKDSNKWEVKVWTPEGEFLELKEYDDQKTAYTAIKDHNKNSPKSPVNVEKAKMANEMTFLEKGIDAESINLGDDESHFLQPDVIAKIEKFDREYKEKLDGAEEKAKELLNAVAKEYLKADQIDKTEYVKFKTAIQEKGFRFILLQLKLSEQNLYYMSQEIALGNRTARMFEVFNGMQKMAMEISNTVDAYMTTIEEGMKKLNVDLELNSEMKGISAEEGDMAIEGKEAGNVVIKTNSRKKLLGELNSIIAEAKEEVKIPRSANEELHDDDPDLVDIDHSNLMPKEEADEIDTDTSGLGLNTLDNEDDDEEDI